MSICIRRVSIGFLMIISYTLIGQPGRGTMHVEVDHSGRQVGDAGIRFVFYNAENLFDTRNDPGKGDDAYLPLSEREWQFGKYRKKLIAIARVIIHCGGWEPPELIGLAEVERRGVLEDLLRLTPLTTIPYGIIHFESPDPRGIDVALLYRKDRIKPLFSHAIRFNLEDHGLGLTRDILYSRVLVENQDTLHLFINHWPSRFGGHLQTIPRRLAAARRLHAYIDSIQLIHQDAMLIVAGDFNDEPGDTSLGILTRSEQDRARLINLMDPLSRQPGKGSHKHAGNWGFLDQILVSPNLLTNKTGWSVLDGKAWIFEAPYLLEKEARHPGHRPFRSFAGIYYQGGFSDHLPVCLQLERTLLPERQNKRKDDDARERSRHRGRKPTSDRRSSAFKPGLP